MACSGCSALHGMNLNEKKLFSEKFFCCFSYMKAPYQSPPSFSVSCSFWPVSRRCGSCSNRLELLLDRLSLVYQQGFFLSAGLSRGLSAFLARISGYTVNTEVEFMNARNLYYTLCHKHPVQTILVYEI